MVRRISTGSPFEAKIGYSRAVVDRDMVYVSGTTGYDYATMTMPEDAGQQARNALITIVRYYLVDMSVYDAVVAAAGEAFDSIRPAPTMVIAGLTTPEMKIEIEVTARIGASQG
jgi:enamine deaminase RidA (YjgF/YER057c/UK114 family)